MNKGEDHMREQTGELAIRQGLEVSQECGFCFM